MADAPIQTKSCSSSLLNYSRSVAAQNCEKCAELKLQLQIMRDELSSVHLIIQMLNTDQNRKDPNTTWTPHAQDEKMGNESWNKIKNKGTKRRSEGNMNLQNSQLHNIKEAALTTNRFTPLINSNMTINEDEMHSACEFTSQANNSDWKRVVKNPKLVCSTSRKLQERLTIYTKEKYNLKTHSKTLQHPYKTKEESYPIPTILTGQKTNKEPSMNIKQMSSHQQQMKQKTIKTLASSPCKRNKVLIIGDSHVRGLSEKISNQLNIPCNVTGI